MPRIEGGDHRPQEFVPPEDDTKAKSGDRPKGHRSHGGDKTGDIGSRNIEGEMPLVIQDDVTTSDAEGEAGKTTDAGAPKPPDPKPADQPKDPNQFTADTETGNNVVIVVTDLTDEAKAAAEQALKEALAQEKEKIDKENALKTADTPAETPPEPVRQFIEAIQKEMLERARAGKLKDHKGEVITVNKWLSGTYITVIAQALQQAAKMLSNIAGQEAAFAVLERQAVKELVAREMDIIIQQGDIEQKQLRQSADLQLAGAIVGLTVQVGGVAMTNALASRAHPLTDKATGARLEGDALSAAKMSQARFAEQSNAIFGEVGKVSTAAFDAKVKTIEAESKVNIAGYQASDRFFQDQKQARERSRGDRLEAMRKARDTMEDVQRTQMQLLSSAYRSFGISPHAQSSA